MEQPQHLWKEVFRVINFKTKYNSFIKMQSVITHTVLQRISPLENCCLATGERARREREGCGFVSVCFQMSCSDARLCEGCLLAELRVF